MRLASLDGELFVKNCFWKFRIISSSIDPRRMKMPPFDASRHGDSDDMCFKFMRSLDGEILQFKSQFLELSGYFWQVSVLHYFIIINFIRIINFIIIIIIIIVMKLVIIYFI